MSPTNQIPRILYLEDTPQEAAAHIRVVQEQLGTRVELATSYAEAAYLLQTEPPFSLFVLDIEMRNERASGIQLAEQLRSLTPYRHTPILFTSMHAHYSHRLLSNIRHSAFLPKPFTSEALVQQIGLALDIPRYTQTWYRPAALLLEIGRGPQVELDPHEISFIELKRHTLHVQYMDGRTLDIDGESGSFKKLLLQIEQNRIDRLRQIYRSVLINVDQVREVKLHGNAGDVWLFGDNEPKPVGIQYRKNLKEFL